MNELRLLEKAEGFIPLYETDKGEKVVSGLDLYEGLGVSQKTQPSDWIKSQLEKVDVTENDFIVLKRESIGGRPGTDYIIKLETAKEICLVAGASNRANPELKRKSKEYRKYLISVEEKYKELQIQNELMLPKADYFDNLVERNLLTNFRDTAKELHIKERAFIKWLLENKYIYRDSKNKLKPYSQYVDAGLFEIKEFGNSKFAGTQTLITPKGRETFRLLYKEL